MLFDMDERPVRKPVSIWELERVREAIELKIETLLLHRAEVSMGEYIWDASEKQKEYYELRRKRNKLINKVAEVSLD